MAIITAKRWLTAHQWQGRKRGIGRKMACSGSPPQRPLAQDDHVFEPIDLLLSRSILNAECVMSPLKLDEVPVENTGELLKGVFDLIATMAQAFLAHQNSLAPVRDRPCRTFEVFDLLFQHPSALSHPFQVGLHRREVRDQSQVPTLWHRACGADHREQQQGCPSGRRDPRLHESVKALRCWMMQWDQVFLVWTR